MRVATARFQTWVWIVALVPVFAVSTPKALGDIPPGSRSGEYLVVTASEFFNGPALNEFTAAKALQGFNVTVYEAVPGTHRGTIKSYIESWYSSTAICYVLLVGDTVVETVEVSTATRIPCWEGSSTRTPPTDLYYACMDGVDDWYPDLFIGRFSVTSESELQAIVDKTLHVEAGIFSDPTYAQRAMFLCSGEDETCHAWTTHDWVIDTYMFPAGFDSDTLYFIWDEEHPYSWSTQVISDAVNAGTLFLVHGGHGSSAGWWSPSFDQDDIALLTNGGLYGLVYSWSCRTAAYGYPDAVFGETWLREGERGAVAYIGASEEVPWSDDLAWEPTRRLEKYFFQSLLADGIWEVGPAWQAALYRLLADPDFDPTVFPGLVYTIWMFEVFNVWGDPSLLLPLYGDGDFDNDDDVDLSDVARFQACFGHNGLDDCGPAHLAEQRVIDLDDYAELDSRVTGPDPGRGGGGGKGW